MNVYELAHYQHFSFLGFVEFLAVSWKEMVRPINLSREEHLMYEATENQDADWLKEFAFDEPALTILTHWQISERAAGAQERGSFRDSAEPHRSH